MEHLNYNEFWSLREVFGKDLHLLYARKMCSDWDLKPNFLAIWVNTLPIRQPLLFWLTCGDQPFVRVICGDQWHSDGYLCDQPCLEGHMWWSATLRVTCDDQLLFEDYMWWPAMFGLLWRSATFMMVIFNDQLFLVINDQLLSKLYGQCPLS